MREVVPVALLEALAAQAPAEEKAQTNGHRKAQDEANRFLFRSGSGWSRDDVAAFLDRAGLDVSKEGPWKGDGSYRWVLAVCPFNSDHSRGEAWLAHHASGAIAAGCLHESCNWKWADLRQRYEPPRWRRADRNTNTHTTHRTLCVTRASTIKARPVRWLWEGRIALGSLALLPGREGIGKSTVAHNIAAQITTGTLPGHYAGAPKSVIVAATEDSWEHTIVPRLMAADADLDRVLRVEVTTSEGVASTLSLPRDLHALEALIVKHEVALIILDPLMSRLDAGLDTHKDAEVRLALEPLVSIADRTEAAALGLIHVNKSSSTDPLSVIMASRAFPAVARAVLFAVADPDDSGLFHLGQPKNNLGRTDLPTLDYRIVTKCVATTDEGAVYTGNVTWVGESERSISDLLESATEDAEARTAVSEAADWLTDYLKSVGGTAESAKIKEESRKAGHSVDALKRARRRSKVTTESSGFPRRTYWRLAVGPVGATPGESAPTAPTAPTDDQLVQSAQSVESPPGDSPTGRQSDDDGDELQPGCGEPR